MDKGQRILEEHSFELRNSYGTQHLPWHSEKSFAGIHTEYAEALKRGESGNMPTAREGIVATRIARTATEQAIRDRDRASRDCPSSAMRRLTCT